MLGRAHNHKVMFYEVLLIPTFITSKWAKDDVAGDFPKGAFQISVQTEFVKKKEIKFLLKPTSF